VGTFTGHSRRLFHGHGHERLVEVGLTARGQALRQRMDEVPFRVALATGLTEAELVALRDTLTQITETIYRHKKEQ
jgi:hypothetical protein